MASNGSLELPPLATVLCSGPEPFLKFIIPIVLSVLTVALNSLVLFVVVFHAHMRTAFNLFFASLAVADLLMGTANYAFLAIEAAYSGLWPLGKALCIFWSVFDSACGTVSLFHLLAISVYRLRCLVTPSLHYRAVQRRHKLAVLLGILAIWTTPLALWTAFYVVDAPTAELLCMSSGESKVFVIVSSVLVYALPILAIVTVNAITRMLVWRKERVYVANRTNASYQVWATRENYDKKAARTLLVTTVAFALCWIPMVIEWVVGDVFGHHPEELAEYIIYLIYYFHSALQPFFLLLFNDNFRRPVARLIRCQDTD